MSATMSIGVGLIETHRADQTHFSGRVVALGGAADREVVAGQGRLGGQRAGDLCDHGRPRQICRHGLSAEVRELGLGRQRLADFCQRRDLE